MPDKTNVGTTELWLKVTASRGQFSDEMAVAATDCNGNEFSLFVGRRDVWLERELSGDESPALLRVFRLTQEGDLVLIALPGQTFANGSIVTVRKGDLCEEPLRRPALSSANCGLGQDCKDDAMTNAEWLADDANIRALGARLRSCANQLLAAKQFAAAMKREQLSEAGQARLREFEQMLTSEPNPPGAAG